MNHQHVLGSEPTVSTKLVMLTALALYFGCVAMVSGGALRLQLTSQGKEDAEQGL